MISELPDAGEGRPLRFRAHARIWKWLLGDAFRRKAPPVAGGVARTVGLGARLVSWTSYLKHIMASQRFYPSAAKTATLRRALEDCRTRVPALMPDDITLKQAANRSIVLRPPRREDGRTIPGVLLIKFTETLRFFAHQVNIDRLQEYFRIVIEPSWAGYALPEILFLHNARDPIVVEAAEATDRKFLEWLDSALVPVPLGSGEWVDYRVFKPLGLDRDYDAVYVANYTPVKRVPIFLRAVRDIVRSGESFRAALVCSRWGTGRDTVLDFIRWYGIQKYVTLYESLTQTEVNDVLNRSRCNVLMSLKEGSNRSLFEGMFAGIPALVLAENIGVNKDHFTSATGVVVPERALPEALLRISRGFDAFSPREWAMENISPEASTQKISAKLDGLFPEDSDRRPLLIKVNAPEARYFDEVLRPVQVMVSYALLSQFLRTALEPSPEEVLRAVEPIDAARSGPFT